MMGKTTLAAKNSITNSESDSIEETDTDSYNIPYVEKKPEKKVSPAFKDLNDKKKEPVPEETPKEIGIKKVDV